jgi:hypothetical protein
VKPLADTNESAATLAWLSRTLALTRDTSSSRVRAAWATTRSQMLRGSQAFLYSQIWISDFWIARSSKNTPLSLAPSWDPPEAVEEWPSLGVRHVIDESELAWFRTRQMPFGAVTGGGDSNEANGAALSFFELRSAIRQHGDVRMKQLEHVRAWLGTAFGHLLMSVALTPAEDVDALIENAVERLRIAQRVPLSASLANEFEERRLDLLFNLRVTPEGLLQSSETMIGQGEEWREHWDWLSAPLGVSEMLQALQLAARLLRCPPMAAALVRALDAEDEYLQTVALAVVRRWVLTVKVMTWLEAALARSWEWVRPEDLVCFAFNALKPDWPRRVVAISHRSADVKPTLTAMELWRSGRCAIDSNYVPSWETNTGMMWGLFAATPAIVRVRSETYTDSVWCCRELELSQYLLDDSDFLLERWVLDIDRSSLAALDRIPASWTESPQQADAAQTIFREFPPLCQVWTTEPLPEWETVLLRAGAALRLVSVFLSDPALANKLAAELSTGLELPGPAATNNPRGWDEYAAIFRDLRALCEEGDGEFPMRLPADYSVDDQEHDRALAGRVPDLSTGSPALPDVLVALEWLRVEWPAMVEEGLGNFLIADCRPFSRDRWVADPGLSLLRGLAVVRLSVPLWFVQSAGQDVETWPFVRERPIFTQHVDGQFGWMLEMLLPRPQAQALYPGLSGLELSDDLLRRCAGGS